MELAPLIPLRLPATRLRLARAKLPEILRSLGHDILEQLHLDPAQLLPCLLMSVIRSRHGGSSSPAVSQKGRVVDACAG
jgi:hypothetical protein